MKRENEIAKVCFEACLRIHQHFGPGLLESACSAALGIELNRLGLRHRSEVPFDIVYEGIPLGLGFRADLVIEDLVIVELKSVEELVPVHYKQLLTYLKATDLKLGLLVNFGAPLLKDGFKRVVNGLSDA